MANPALYFAVRNVTFTPTVTGYLVTCYTNNPAHLFLRWTATTPQKHINTRVVRGAPVGTYIDQCFVVYTDVEQNEPGDTWTHTFTLDNWLYCQTRWFYFWGTVSGEVSPSASCIFKHHSTIVPFMDFYPAPGSGGSSCDGRVARVLANQTWLQIHSGAGNQAQTGATNLVVMISAYTAANRFDAIHRSILTFPTATLGAGITIQAATLRLYCESRNVDAPWVPGVAVFGASPALHNNLSPSDYSCVWSIPRSNEILMENVPINDFVEFTFNALGLALVNPTGVTELSIRESRYDAPYSEPPWFIHNDCWTNYASADTLTPAHRPRLRVWYLPTA